MRVKLVADVEGNVATADMTTFSMGDFTVNLEFANGDGTGGLETVSVGRELNDDEAKRFKNKLVPTGESRYHWEMKGIVELHEEAINKLQTLESFFGLHGVDRLNWQGTKFVFVPETDEEVEQLDTNEIQLSKSYPNPPHDWVFDLSEYDWDEIERLKVPLAFYRRGEIRHQDFDYISAFMEYYFVIEGFYAEGDWQNVEDRYINSDELMKAAKITLEDLSSEKRDELNQFFEFYNKEQTAEGYIRLITVLRHQLHHYFFEDESGPHAPNLFDTEDYQPISLALGHTVFLILLWKTEEIDLPDNQTES